MKPLEGSWSILKDGSIFASFGTKFDRLPDFSWIPKGDNSTKNVYVIQAKSPLKKITGSAAGADDRSDTSLQRAGAFDDRRTLPLGGACWRQVASGCRSPRRPLTFRGCSFRSRTRSMAIPARPWDIEAGPGLRNQDRKAVFTLRQPLEIGVGGALTISLVQKQQERINIGRFRLSVTDEPAPQADPLPRRTSDGFSRMPAGSSGRRHSKREIFSAYRTTVS
jgi:hypothetical protein